MYKTTINDVTTIGQHVQAQCSSGLFSHGQPPKGEVVLRKRQSRDDLSKNIVAIPPVVAVHGEGRGTYAPESIAT